MQYEKEKGSRTAMKPRREPILERLLQTARSVFFQCFDSALQLIGNWQAKGTGILQNAEPFLCDVVDAGSVLPYRDVHRDVEPGGDQKYKKDLDLLGCSLSHDLARKSAAFCVR